MNAPRSGESPEEKRPNRPWCVGMPDAGVKELAVRTSSFVPGRHDGAVPSSTFRGARLIKPPSARHRDIRCTGIDRLVETLPISIVFFFERHLDADALSEALSGALAHVPVYAGRISVARGEFRIRCRGQGVSFTVASSEHTLTEAIRSTAENRGHWLVDQVDVVSAHRGRSPLLAIRVTHLADGSTAIGCCFHHSVGDLRSFMSFVHAWAAVAAGKSVSEALIVEDRSAYLDERLPPDTARVPGVRAIRLSEAARLVLYAAKDARKKTTVSLYFGDDEVHRMRNAYGPATLLTTNDVVCAHVSEALMLADPAAARRTLAIAVNVRKRCGLDPMLFGNMVTLLKVEVRRGEGAATIANRIRHGVDHFVDEHLDMRSNLKLTDAAGTWGIYRCAPAAFDVRRWGPGVTNWSNEGLHRVRFEGVTPSYVTPVMNFLVPGTGVMLEGAGGRGVLLVMTLPPEIAEAMSSPTIRDHLRRFRREDDAIPELHRDPS